VTDCNDNCGTYCKLASKDDDIHSANLKDLKEINAKLQLEVDQLSSKFLREYNKKRTTNFYDSSTPRYGRYDKYGVNIQVGKGNRKSKKRLRKRKTRKGGLSFWGSTTDIKPCETACKRECPYQCKTISVILVLFSWLLQNY
jgi:hypothetical protein